MTTGHRLDVSHHALPRRITSEPQSAPPRSPFVYEKFPENYGVA